jgi:uncharacterized protein YegL
MKKDLSLLVFIIDASSSMTMKAPEVVSSVNQAIKDRKDANSDELISIYQFANDTKNILDFKHVSEVSQFDYECNGWTALRDAIGYTIKDVGCKLNEMAEEDRPEKIQVMILTDGEENSSKNYSPEQVKEMVEHQTEKYSWLFTYVGSNQDAILAGSQLGIARGLCANYSDNNLGHTLSMVSSKMLRAKGAEDYSSMVNLASYSLDDREALVKNDNS